MSWYHIENRLSGFFLGYYKGATAEEAWKSLVQEAQADPEKHSEPSDDITIKEVELPLGYRIKQARKAAGGYRFNASVGEVVYLMFPPGYDGVDLKAARDTREQAVSEAWSHYFWVVHGRNV